jgi:hypothetical protein
MSVNKALVEAVDRFKKAEQEVIESRKVVADLLVIASKTQPVTGISILTGINRTTIYWLMKTWSNSEDRNPPNRGSKG